MLPAPILGLLAALGIAIAGQAILLSHCNDKVSRLELLVGLHESAADANLDTIAKLESQNAALAKAVAVAEGDAVAAQAAAEAAQAAADLAVQLAKTSRQEIYDANPDAAAWAAMRVPDAIADRLRQ